jgi:hypothetical protein
VEMYKYGVSSFAYVEALAAADAANADQFGKALALSYDVLVVGSAGGTYSFDKVAGGAYTT